MNISDIEFKKIYDIFQPKILRYLTRLVSEKHEAEDLTQEVFIKVSNGLKNFKGESKLSTWIYRIATNVALDRQRSPYYRIMVQKNLFNDLIEEANEYKNVWTGEKTPFIEQKLIQKEMSECIRDYVENLQEDYRPLSY